VPQLPDEGYLAQIELFEHRLQIVGNPSSRG
jgi:hypothetical protein